MPPMAVCSNLNPGRLLGNSQVSHFSVKSHRMAHGLNLYCNGHTRNFIYCDCKEAREGKKKSNLLSGKHLSEHTTAPPPRDIQVHHI